MTEKTINKHQFLFAVLVLLWTAFIWGHSLQPAAASSQESGFFTQLLAPLLQFFHIPADWQETVIRKTAHFIEFAVLGGLWTILLAGKRFWIPLAASAVTAASDETIQLFTEGRSGRITDVFLDTAGALTAILLVKAAFILWKKEK